MKLYEILFIVHPNYEESRLTKIVDNVKGKIINNGGTIIDVTEIGKKKLAYKIENQRYGSYVLIHFESKPQFILEFKKWLKIQTQILARIIVKLDKKDLVEKYKKDSIEEKRVATKQIMVEEIKTNKVENEQLENKEVEIDEESENKQIENEEVETDAKSENKQIDNKEVETDAESEDEQLENEEVKTDEEIVENESAE